MAYQTGSSTTIEDLLTQLFTFAVANGWTQDNLDAGNKKASLHKNNVYVHFQWTESTNGGTLAMYQSLGYIGSGTNNWQHTDDSGTGVASTTAANLQNERCVNQCAGPHDSYFFFENDSSPAYIHVVLEISSGRYRHFGFGELSKIGDWTGGEYVYGHFWNQTNADIDNPRALNHYFLFEGASTGTILRGGTMHLENFTTEPSASTKWAPMNGLGSASNDRAGVGRHRHLIGGGRCSPMAAMFSQYKISELNAYKPLIPIPLYHRDAAAASVPRDIRLLGYMPDVFLCNISQVNPKDVVTVGSDTYMVFPWVRKQYLLNDTEESWNAGVAYKKITA